MPAVLQAFFDTLDRHIQSKVAYEVLHSLATQPTCQVQ